MYSIHLTDTILDLFKILSMDFLRFTSMKYANSHTLLSLCLYTVIDYAYATVGWR